MVYRMVFNVDGGCRGNGTPDAIGAVACCLQKPHGNRYECETRRLRNYPVPPTSQRAEIIAIIIALLWALKRYDKLRGYPILRVTIYSDSRYAVNCMTDWIYKWTRNGWTNSRGFGVANQDLIKDASFLDDLVKEIGSVEYVWVPRADNVNADSECQRALDEQEDG